MDLAQVASKVRAENPLTLLRTLAELVPRDRLDLSTLPLVTLQLAYGHALEGIVLRFDGRAGEENVSLLVDLHRGSTGEKVAYVSARSILSVIVHNPSRFASLVTGGDVADPPAGPVPTRLQLRRELESLQLGVTLNVDWEGIPSDDVANANVRDLFVALSEVARNVQKDAIGKKAWSEVKTFIVKHRSGSALAVTRSGATVELSCDFTRTLPSNPGARLEQLLNSAF